MQAQASRETSGELNQRIIREWTSRFQRNRHAHPIYFVYTGYTVHFFFFLEASHQHCPVNHSEPTT
jgi:hypothetical protein